MALIYKEKMSLNLGSIPRERKPFANARTGKNLVDVTFTYPFDVSQEEHQINLKNWEIRYAT